jgi:hypothetical protein
MVYKSRSRFLKTTWIALWGCLQFWCITSLNAQVPTEPIVPDTISGELVVDTSEVYILYPENPYEEFDLADTLLGRYFTQYDPIRQQGANYGHLGNMGSAHYPLLFQPEQRRGFELGFHQFDLYRRKVSDLPFYRLEQAYTRAGFTPGLDQENTAFNLEFGAPLGKDVSVALQLHRINNEGAFAFQRAQANSFSTGIWYRTPNRRYQAFASYGSNSNRNENNGGILAEPTDQGEVILVEPFTIGVRLDDPIVRLADRSFEYRHFYAIIPPRDSSNRRQRSLMIHHRANATTQTYKYYQDNALVDSSFYGPFFTDLRGVRVFMEHQALENDISIRWFRQAKVDSTGVRKVSELFDAGIVHTFHNVDEEVQDSSFQNLFLRGKVQLQLGEIVKLKADGHFGLLANRGDYRINGQLQVDLNRWGRLDAVFTNQLFTPSLLQHRLFVTQQPIWENDFQKTLQTTIGGIVTFPGGRFKAGTHYHLINNQIFYDTLGIVRQTGVPVSVLQLMGEANFKVWKLHLDNLVHLQLISENTLPLPRLYSTHSLYFEGFLFKQAMLARIGFDARITDDFQPYAFVPQTGQFRLSTGFQTGWQPMVDAFVAFKVRTFRFFFRAENLLPFLTNDYYYLVEGHPIPQAGLRAGISWRFTD